MYQDIENKMLDLAICKGLACDDVDIELEEQRIENELNLQRFKRDDSEYGRRSTNSELC